MTLPHGLLITPYASIGPLRFRMQPLEVEAAIGAPSIVRANRRGERDERRERLAIRYDKANNALVEVSIEKGVGAIIENIDVFRSPNPLATLSAIDPLCFEGLGEVVFFGLGLAVPINILEPNSTPWITVFERGRWDGIRANLKPFVAGSAA